VTDNGQSSERMALSAKALGYANAELIQRHKPEWEALLEFYRIQVGLPAKRDVKKSKSDTRPAAPDYVK
jgi:hypothetical protein